MQARPGVSNPSKRVPLAVRSRPLQPSMIALKTALRVLTALAGRLAPEAEDVAALHRYAPDLVDSPADELACDVIQLALKVRARVRSAADGPTST